MEIVAWIIVIALFALGMAGAVFPILPGVLAIYLAFFVYGFMVSFDPFGFWFWFIQTVFLAAIFVADYVVSAKSVTKYGGSRASVIGSTIGIIFGPFVIPVAGLVIGPFLGAVVGEMLHKPDFQNALKVGWGSLIGLLSSTLMKIALQLLMIVIFVLWIIWG